MFNRYWKWAFKNPLKSDVIEIAMLCIIVVGLFASLGVRFE